MIMIFPTYSQAFFNRHMRNAIVSLIKIIHTHYLIWTISSNQWLMYLMFFRGLNPSLVGPPIINLQNQLHRPRAQAGNEDTNSTFGLCCTRTCFIFAPTFIRLVSKLPILYTYMPKVYISNSVETAVWMQISYLCKTIIFIIILDNS